MMLVASSRSNNVVQHLESNGEHLYFIIGGTMTEIFLYFIKQKEALEGDFITYNAYTGEISISDRIIHEPNVSSFPIVDILNQDILPQEVLDKVSKL